MTDADYDRGLLRAVRDGNAHALGELYDRHAATLLPVALRILRNRRDAEDLLHDVFVEAWQNAAKFDASRSTVHYWLALRLRSRAIDRIRALQRARMYLQNAQDDHSAQSLHGDTAAASADGVQARKALACLSNVQREVIELGYFRGFSCSEIARRCDIPLGTVKSRLAGALDRLRRQLLAGAETQQ